MTLAPPTRPASATAAAATILALLVTSGPARAAVEHQGSSALVDASNAPLISPSMLMAEAGSIGGSIAPPAVKGGDAKSVSGGRSISSPKSPVGKRIMRSAPKRAAHSVKPRNPEAGDARSTRKSTCKGIAGVWTANGWWNPFYGRGDVMLNADGSARHVSGISGKWLCRSNHFTLDWKDWTKSEGTLSDDGRVVTFNNGAKLTRGR